MEELKECPFCKAGTTNVYSLGDVVMAQRILGRGGIKVYFVVEHWCDKILDTQFRTVSFYGRTKEEAISLWNNRV